MSEVNMMIAYRYASEGLYIGTIPCQIDPRASKEAGEDVYLVPANSTLIEPPAQKEDYNIVWNGEAWEYVEIPKPPTPPEPTPEEIIEQKIAQLDSQYNSDKAILMSQYTEADIDGDEDLKATIKAELVALREQYDKDYEEIVGGAE
jgi:hypothetical protein